MAIDKHTPFKLDIIDKAGIEKIHAGALEILLETGVFVENPEAFQLLADAGCVTGKDGLVKIQSKLVQQSLESAPPEFNLYTRDGVPSMHLAKGNTYFGTGSDCLFVLDPDTGERRRTIRTDIATFAKLSDALANIDFILSMGHASDVPEETADLHHFREMLVNTSKPIVFTSLLHENFIHIYRFASELAGGKDELRDRPFLAYFGMPSPPLRHGNISLQNLMLCAKEKLPIVYASGTQIGFSGPMTIAGSIIASHCDVISGLVIHQLANPGAPFIYGVCIAPFDMHAAVEAYAAPEHFYGDIANVQVANHFNLPTWGYAGNADSKVVDMQTGLEYLGSTLMGLLSNCNMMHDVGYLESGKTASCESILLGNVVIEYCRQMLQTIPVDDENLALESIKNVGPGGNFFTDYLTLKNMRNFWYSPFFDRNTFSKWVSDGSQRMDDRIRSEVQNILVNHAPLPLEEGFLKRLDEFIAAQEETL